MRRHLIAATTASFAMLVISSAQAGSVIEEQMGPYQDHGAGPASPANGEALWYQSSSERSCTSCHGKSPTEQGRHAKTRKPIKPMAPTVNPDRYTDSKKIEKWFLRNCKWTFGRVCTPQEKTDILSWLASQ